MANGACAHQLLDPFGHLAGRLVGEGDGENRVRRDADVFDQVSDAIGDDAGLAAAGPGQDQHRPFDGFDRLALLWIQFVEKMLQR